MSQVYKLPGRLLVQLGKLPNEEGSNIYMLVMGRDATNTLGKLVKPNVIMVLEEQETYTRHDQYNYFKGNIDK